MKLLLSALLLGLTTAAKLKGSRLQEPRQRRRQKEDLLEVRCDGSDDVRGLGQCLSHIPNDLSLYFCTGMSQG
jgi:hypothetical protein